MPDYDAEYEWFPNGTRNVKLDPNGIISAEVKIKDKDSWRMSSFDLNWVLTWSDGDLVTSYGDENNCKNFVSGAPMWIDNGTLVVNSLLSDGNHKEVKFDLSKCLSVVSGFKWHQNQVQCLEWCHPRRVGSAIGNTFLSALGMFGESKKKEMPFPDQGQKWEDLTSNDDWQKWYGEERAKKNPGEQYGWGSGWYYTKGS